MIYPKIELHVHLEATVQPATLLAIASRNGYDLPADSVEGIRALYRYTDFNHFVQVWILTTNALRTADDFRQITVDYAGEAKRHGAVYVEAIFSPLERVARGVGWDEIFSGYCDGVQEAKEVHGVEMRLTPDITRRTDPKVALELVERAVDYRDRGVVGIGLGGEEALFPPEPFAEVFRVAKDAGFGSVPHAGEVAGPDSIRGAVVALGADRIRHGIRAVDDPTLVEELAERQIVLDVTPVSNLRTGAVKSLAEHPLPALLAAGVRCSVSTDDPVMFGTDLTRDYDVARKLGASPRELYEHALAGALCDDPTRGKLAAIGAAFAWESIGLVAR